MNRFISLETASCTSAREWRTTCKWNDVAARQAQERTMSSFEMRSSSQTGSSELHAELRDLGSRDLQLWSIGLLVLTVVALGFLVLVAPNLLWKSGPVQIETRFL